MPPRPQLPRLLRVLAIIFLLVPAFGARSCGSTPPAASAPPTQVYIRKWNPGDQPLCGGAKGVFGAFAQIPARNRDDNRNQDLANAKQHERIERCRQPI
jgi:hypothetical protein